MMRFRRIYFPRRRNPPPMQYVLLMTTVIFIIVILCSLWLIDRGIRPALLNIAELKTVEFATRTINSAVKSTEEISFDDLVEMEMDNNGNVATLGWNSEAVNRALRTATDRAEYFLYGMNKGEQIDVDDPEMHPIEFGDTVGDLASKDPTVVEIPLGQVTGNTVLANLGPKIPVHFEIVGSLRSDVVHEETEFGIYGVWFSFYLNVVVTGYIIISFSSTVSHYAALIYLC